MTSTSRLPWGPALLLATALALGPPPLHAQERSFLDAYKAGVDAAEAEDWPEAERLMRAAIAGRAEEADRLIRHFHLRPYIPHFYLGLALAERGECQEALEAFAESERQGVVTGLSGELAVLRDRESSCRELEAAREREREQRQAVIDLVERAGQAAESVSELAADPLLAPGWERGDPSLADRLAEAEAAVAEARERLAGDEPEDLTAATDLARGALGKLEAIRRESQLRRDAADDERNAAAARVASLARAGRELLASTRELGTAAPTVDQRRTALAEVVDRATGRDATPSLAELRELATALERRVAELRTAAAPPPAALLAAADAWLRGESWTVLALLVRPEDPGGDPPFDDPRARAHALLLRSAAAFSLHAAEPDRDDTLLEAARRDAEACQALAPDLIPLSSVFSPRFRAFWTTVGSETGLPPAAH